MMTGLGHLIALASLVAYSLAAEECEENRVLLLQGQLSVQKTSTVLSPSVIGTTTAVIDGESESCRDQECQYGNLLCDELLRYGRDKYGSQIALYNGGGIRASLPKGSITRDDILKVHPYGNNATFFKLKGKSLQQMLEDMLAEHGAGPGEAGSYLQVAGLRFQASYDGSAWTLHNVLVKNPSGPWDDLDMDTMYSIVSNSYIMEGNGGREIASSNLELLEANGPNIANFMIEYFSKNSPVSPTALDGRTFHEHASRVVGTASAFIDGEAASCREHSCAYGVLLCDQMLWVGKQAGHGTQIALYNGGGIRASVPRGDVTVDTLLAIHPYGNLVSFFKVQGGVITLLLKDMLAEHGAPGNGTEGSWEQMAGLRFEASWGGSSWILGKVEVEQESGAWEALNSTAEYSLASNTYVRFGNGGREVVSSSAVSILDDGPMVLGIMMGLFKASSPVAPPAETLLLNECLTGDCPWTSAASVIGTTTVFIVTLFSCCILESSLLSLVRLLAH